MIKRNYQQNIIEVFISKALTGSANSHDKFVLTINMQKQYNDMKEEINGLKTWSVLQS